jgi:hypothetical protein
MNQALPPGVGSREYLYHADDFKQWKKAHDRWWPRRDDPSVWGAFARQAVSDRYLFGRRDQGSYHFGEALVGRDLEREGYDCWTAARIFHRPNRVPRGIYATNTAEVNERLGTGGLRIPQEEYERRYREEGLLVKNIDIVAHHPGNDHWVFCEVKRAGDRLKPEQREALRLLVQLFANRADVFVALVRERSRA